MNLELESTHLETGLAFLHVGLLSISVQCQHHKEQATNPLDAVKAVVAVPAFGLFELMGYFGARGHAPFQRGILDGPVGSTDYAHGIPRLDVHLRRDSNWQTQR
jgi:hypothetical protein